MENQDSKKPTKLSEDFGERGSPTLVVSDQIETTDGTGAVNTVQDIQSPPHSLLPVQSALSDLGLPSQYQVVELLGEGGMAHVYKAIDTANGGNEVAIKILRPEIVPDPTIVERFFREAKAAQKLAHPNLVSVFGYGTTDSNMPYLIMEYVAGKNLAQIITEEKYLAADRAIKIFVQIAEGLRDAHKLGVVHRDLKPSNILIATNDDGSESVKIADFGIAKPASSERTINPDLTRTGAILGSPAYMSPEQCLGHVVDERSDIYSMGCLIYETLTGRSPFWSNTPVKSLIRHLEEQPEPFEIEFKHLEIQKGLEAIVMKCLEKEPARRFQRIEQLMDALTASVDPGARSRFCAEGIDVILLAVLAGISMRALLFAIFALQWGTGCAPSAQVVAMITGYYAIFTGYYVIFEFSKLQATPGKLLTGMKVMTSDGRRLNLASTIFSSITIANVVLSILCCALFMSIFCFRIPHHWPKGMNAPFYLAMLTSLFVLYPMFLNNGRRTLFDYLFDRRVTRPIQSSHPANFNHIIKHALLCLVSFLIPVLGWFSFPYLNQANLNSPFLRTVVCVKLSKNLQPDQIITADDVQTLSAPPMLIPEGTAFDTSQVLGRRCLHDLPPLEAIRAKDLAPPEETPK